MLILGVDPGTTESGVVLYHPGEHRVANCAVIPNGTLLSTIVLNQHPHAVVLAIEMIHSQGMAVGAEVFETCVWIGRFMQAWRDPEAVLRIKRHEVKMHICGHPRAKDSNIRQQLIDLFPPTGASPKKHKGGMPAQIGTAKEPGPLFGMNSHTWPALAVAITAAARLQGVVPKRRRLPL